MPKVNGDSRKCQRDNERQIKIGWLSLQLAPIRSVFIRQRDMEKFILIWILDRNENSQKIMFIESKSGVINSGNVSEMRSSVKHGMIIILEVNPFN